MTQQVRNVTFGEIADHVLSTEICWRNRTESIIDLWNDPPRRDGVSIPDIQQVILLYGILAALKDLNKSVDGTRRAIDRLPDKLKNKRLRDQLKVAQAREKAAKAELAAKLHEPPIVVQCDHETLDKLTSHVRRRF